jgi:hypothetical protein
MKVVTFADEKTGEFKHSFSTNDETAVALSTPAGHIAVEGRHDRLSKRYDIAAGKVIEYQPPSPSSDHRWDETSTRWVLNEDVKAKLQAKAAARSQIELLERQQGRALREHALGDAAAADRLKALDDRIAALRKDL